MAPMINRKCSHEENRKKVCAPCGEKISCGNTKLEKFEISSEIASLIKKYVCSDFDMINPKFPLSICVSCRLTLQEKNKQNTKRPMPIMPNYLDISLAESGRSPVETCNCYICLTGRQRGARKKFPKGNGRKRVINNVITESNGLCANSSVVKINVKPPSQHSRNEVLKICSKCLQQTGRGIKHPCARNTRVAPRARKNIQEIIGTRVSKENQEKIAAQIIKTKLNREVEDNRRSKDLQLELSNTGPKKLKIVLNPSEKPSIVFDTKTLDNFQTNVNASANDMKKITSMLRSAAGRKSVPSYYNDHVSARSRDLDDVYQTSLAYFDTDSGGKQERPVVWANAEQLVEAVVTKRNLIGNYKIKIMADGGQGFFKLSMTLLPEDYAHDSDTEDILGGSEHPTKKKLKLNSATRSLGSSKLTSVKKLILLCVVPNIKETYDNLKILFDLTKLNNISFKFVSDFKLLLMANGQQTATASYPCPYCFVSLGSLRSSQVIDDQHKSAGLPELHLTLESLKNYGNLRSDYNNFCSLGKNKKNASKCHSTINSPLFEENDEVCVLEKCVIPELHILQGYVNHLFWNGLVPLVGRDKALIWPKKLNLISKCYQGEIFEGNACRELLKKADALADPQIYSGVGYFKLVPFISAFKSMDKLVTLCFGTRASPDQENVKKCMSDLRKAFLSTEVSETLKIHVATRHIDQCLYFLPNDEGLGLWSEQAGESVHQEFLKFWKRYKKNSLDNPTYSDSLKKAVVNFSSQHL